MYLSGSLCALSIVAAPAPPSASAGSGCGVVSGRTDVGGPAPALRYENVADSLGVGGDARAWGFSLRDIDADGMPDLYLGHHESSPRFFRNDLLGGGVFVEEHPSLPNWDDFAGADQHSVSILDADADGCVDLYQCVGSARGGRPGDNWLLSFQCGFDPIDLSADSGLLDPYGRGRTPLWLDFDLDGIADLLLLNALSAGNRSRLFRGLGGANFEEIVDGAGLPLDWHWVSGLAADLDEDGDSDLVLTATGVWLFRNEGGLFTDVTAASGINIVTQTDVAMGDVNGDGFVDLVGASFAASTDLIGQPVPEELKYELRLNGPALKGARFLCDSDSIWLNLVMLYAERPEVVWLGSGSVNPAELPLSLSADDPVLLGEPDLIGVAPGAFLWREPTGHWNLRVAGEGEVPGSFERSGGWLRFDSPIDSIETFELEIDAVTARPNHLYRGNGDLTFSDASFSSGFRDRQLQSRDLALGDLDNDGDLDIFVVNGGIVENLPDGLYLNDGSGRFREVSDGVGIPFQPRGSGESVGISDLDRDGRLEILVLNGGGFRPFVGPQDLFRATTRPGRWLLIALDQEAGDPTPLGSRVDLYAGGRRQVRWYDAGQGNRSQQDAFLHFGLGSATIIDSVVVTWPDGSSVRSIAPETDRTIHFSNNP
ncbi:MAG: hypothetical protein CME06_10975 [Gemmatimonadetes bacterium]|nr:hypothetical protein [Gemmatimonadota bacterium]